MRARPSLGVTAADVGRGAVSSYIAIDFETANEQRASPCALALAAVTDGQVTDRWSTLIDPEADFAPMNVAIHGITPEAVAGAPTFPDVAEQFAEWLSGSEAVVAHSAAFDMQVMRASAARYALDVPRFQFACTRVFARRWFPGWPSYALTYCTAQLGIDELLGRDHHNPSWDAEAAALIAINGFDRHQHRDWAGAADAQDVHLGVLDTASYIGCVGAGSSSKIAPQARPGTEFDPEHPLYGITVAFTGTLAHYVRRDAAQLVVDSGGEFSNSVTRATDLLVVGEQDLAHLAGRNTSAKMRKAAGMAASGHHIEIIHEADFFQML